MSRTTIELVDGILTVTLNEPARRNPLSVEVRNEILAAIRPLPADVKAVIFTGAEGIFSAGGDLASMPPANEAAARDRMDAVADFIRYVVELPVVTVAVVEKAAAGAAIGLVCACDVVIAGRGANFLFPFANLGLVPDGGLLALLPQRVGVARARRILLEAAPVNAVTGQALGLVDELADDGEALAAAQEIALRLARRAPGSVRHLKAALAGGAPSLDAAFAAEKNGQAELFFSADFAEGKSAFFDKRAPRFTGE